MKLSLCHFSDECLRAEQETSPGVSTADVPIVHEHSAAWKQPMVGGIKWKSTNTQTQRKYSTTNLAVKHLLEKRYLGIIS